MITIIIMMACGETNVTKFKTKCWSQETVPKQCLVWDLSNFNRHKMNKQPVCLQHPPRAADTQQVGTGAPDTILILFQLTLSHLSMPGAHSRTGAQSQGAARWQRSRCQQQVMQPVGGRAHGTAQRAPPASSCRYPASLPVPLLYW